MGLFGGKTRVTVGTQVSRVISDDLLPNSIQQGVLRAIMRDESIPENVLDGLVSSVGLRAERMYEYAKRSYTHGLPSGQVNSASRGREQVQALLDSLEGQVVEIDYSHFGAPNYLHIGWMRAIADHGYNPQTNRLTVPVHGSVYLHDMQVVVPAGTLNQYEPGSLDQWGPAARSGSSPLNSAGAASLYMAHTPVAQDDSITEPVVRLTYIRQITNVEGQLEWMEGYLTLPVTGYSLVADYFHVKYRVAGVIKYWIYQAGVGTYPTLDAVFNQPPTVTGTFFPFAYFRYQKRSEIEDKTTEAYKTSRKLLKYLGMDYDQVAEAIDENPDIADVEQAMLMLGVPANSTNPLELRYLYQFFDQMYLIEGSGFTSPAQSDILASQRGDWDITKNTIVIQDQRFKMALSNGGLYKKRMLGSVGQVGDVAFFLDTMNIPVTEVVNPDTGGTQTYLMPVKVHCYRRQVNSAQYDEIRVVNLKMLYHVFGHYTVTADETDDALLVPIDHSISEHYSIPDRETLYARSLHYVFNSVVFTKLKWYQTGFFQFVMMVVAVAVTMYSLGGDGGSVLAAVAAGTATLTSVALILLEKLMWSLIIQAGIKLFVKAVGIELAMLAALVSAAMGAYQSISAGSVPGAPWAQELLSLSSGLTQGIQSSMGDLIGDLQNEASAFQSYTEQQTSLLEDANKLLEGRSLLSPLVLFGETPDDFYNRTVHSGNVGAMGISAISSYVDIALNLPKINDTLGGLTV